MKANEINIKNIFIVFILSSSLFAEIGVSAGVQYGGVTYNEEISEHMSITNGIGFNASIEKNIGPTLIGVGYFQQNYTENFNSQDYDDSKFKNTVSTSYITSYVLYPYEIWKFRFFGGLQIAQCLDVEDQISREVPLSSDGYNLDFGFLIGSDIMITKRIGSRFSYYYGIAKLRKEDIDLDINETDLNVMNVAVNAQLLLRF